jgi:7-keto-8-aminopelargonate synthetase-like enzyme
MSQVAKSASAFVRAFLAILVLELEDTVNYPTAPRGTERLRITPAPYHTDTDIEHLVQELAEIWAEVGLTKAA